MMNLDLPRHFKTLRRFLLLEDGEFGSALSRKLFQLVCNKKCLLANQRLFKKHSVYLIKNYAAQIVRSILKRSFSYFL